MLTRHLDWTGTIEGHTDSVGTAAANLALSERRAAALRDRLVSTHKVDQARLVTQGYGSSRPREPNATIEGRARNRPGRDGPSVSRTRPTLRHRARTRGVSVIGAAVPGADTAAILREV